MEPEIWRIQQLLREQTLDVRHLDTAGFRNWLAQHLKRWRHDPAFRQQWAIRRLRRDHPQLRELETQLQQAIRLDEASAVYSIIEETLKSLEDTGKAVAGLEQAVNQADDPVRRRQLEQKLEHFRQQRLDLEKRYRDLVAISPARLQRLELERQLHLAREQTGLARAEETLARLLRQRGQRSGRAGRTFEQQALEHSLQWLMPHLAAQAKSPCRILTGVTLGAARVELDQVVVEVPRHPDQPVRVLALVEAKRNLNDLASGFQARQENLAWLTGDARGYDPAQYRGRHHPSGHFERAAVHREAQETFVFSRESFRDFRRDTATGLFLEGLYFLSRPGPLWGLTSAALGRVRQKLATDIHWQSRSALRLRRFHEWCLNLASPLETPDLLRLYCERPARAGQIILLP